MTSRAGWASDGPKIPLLLFVERAVVADPVTVELDRPRALHPKVSGFWRNREFHRVLKIVETRYEHGQTYFRMVTDRGCVDLRRYHQRDPRTLRGRVTWQVCADLDAAEIPRPS